MSMKERDQMMDLESDTMFCPKCGDVLRETNDTFKCLRGEMEMSRHLATHLYACFVTQSEDPKEPPLPSEITYTGSVGGRWFCPGCGVLMEERTPWAVRCPRCERSIWQFIRELIEIHPHRAEDGSFR